jgi:hypothetical protein
MSQAIATLDLFAEKADRLAELSLAQEILKSYRASVRWVRGEPWTSEYSGPAGEAVDAYMLTLRMLIQDNEPISLRNMRRLYREARIPAPLADQFDEACAELNAFLDADTNLAIEEGRQLTYRDIFEVFVYGSLAHTNSPRKREIFTALRDGAWFPLFQAHFADCLRAFEVALASLRRINTAALAELRGARP